MLIVKVRLRFVESFFFFIILCLFFDFFFVGLEYRFLISIVIDVLRDWYEVGIKKFFDFTGGFGFFGILGFFGSLGFFGILGFFGSFGFFLIAEFIFILWFLCLISELFDKDV